MYKRFPHFPQHNATDCGPACLRMVAAYYGRTYSMEMLRRHCFITREGVSMLGISDAAEHIGMHTLGMHVSLEQLVSDAPLPCILHWNQNHFVVCYEIRRKRNGDCLFRIADPASRRVTFHISDLQKCWVSTRKGGLDCGTVLLLEPGAGFGSCEEECVKSGKSLASFWSYLLPHRRLFLQLLLGMLLGSLLQLIFPFLTQAMVDAGIGNRDIGVVTIILAAQLTLFLAQHLSGFIRSWILLYVNSRVDISLISDFLLKITRMPLSFFDTRKTGDIMQRIGDHGRIKGFLLGNSIGILFSFVNFVIYTCILAWFDLRILGIFLVGNTVYIFWVTWFLRYRRELDARRFSLASTEQSRLIQLIEGMQDIKLNNCERQKRWEWERLQVRLYRVGVRGLTIGQVQQTGSAFLTQATSIFISYIAARSVIEGGMTLGMMMSITYILGQLSVPINDFLSFSRSWQDARISLERLNEIHSQEDEEQGIDRKSSDLPPDKSIRVDHLTFSYSGADRDYALQNLSLTIPEGKVTAIVGESGSGKTTLIKLLQGFYEPNSGSVKVGGVSLGMINPHIWRARTGSVMQESFIFSDTVARNIALSTDEVDVHRLYQAATLANADEFIRDLPLGYNTMIGMEGSGVSQGQRQRLLIARAIYKDPEYLFFDEATNSLDTVNERKIMENLKSFYRGRTVVVAAHRLSTVMDADNIVVMSQGSIVEQGTHRELIQQHGAYYELVHNQLGLSE